MNYLCVINDLMSSTLFINYLNCPLIEIPMTIL